LVFAAAAASARVRLNGTSVLEAGKTSYTGLKAHCRRSVSGTRTQGGHQNPRHHDEAPRL